MSLGFNLVLPIVILKKGEMWFGEQLAGLLKVQLESTMVDSVVLVVAIAFPIGYGLWDLQQRKRWNFISILGAASTLLTGGIGLVPGGTAFMFAVKETALPAVLALLTVATLRTKKPLVKLFLYNPDFLQVDRIEAALKERGTKEAFEALLFRCTWYIASSFILSAVLNYVLARAFVTDDPGKPNSQYGVQVADMMLWSYVAISIPCMAVTFYAFWQLIKGIKAHAGLEVEEVLIGAEQPEGKEL